MFKIMITCPVTKQAVETGIKTASREAFNSNLFKEHIVICPKCYQTHSWRKQDAFLVSDQNRANASLWRPNP